MSVQIITQYDIPVGKVLHRKTRKELDSALGQLSHQIHQHAREDDINSGYASPIKDTYRIVTYNELAAQQVEHTLEESGLMGCLKRLGVSVIKQMGIRPCDPS